MFGKGLKFRVWGSVSEVQAQAQAEFTGPGSPVPGVLESTLNFRFVFLF